jgi:hypothetical protein
MGKGWGIRIKIRIGSDLFKDNTLLTGAYNKGFLAFYTCKDV